MQKIKPHNPFLVAGYYSPDYFCNRVAETNKIISSLENDRNISLMSPRRYGKTGLIHHVFNQLSNNNKDIIYVYLDVFSTQNLNDFVKIFAEKILGKFDSNIEKTMKSFAMFFKSFRPTISYDVLSGQPEISVKIESEMSQNSLEEVFAYLKDSGKRCYIAIDEFQQIAEYPEKGVEALLRSHIQFLQNVKFIFSGSRQHLMSEIFLSAKRPFYQSTQTMSLDVIDFEDYFLFAKNHFQKNNYAISEEAFHLIYNLFDGYTWYIQVLLNRLYEYKRNIDNTEIIYYAIEEILDENVYSYQELMTAYSNVQVNLLRAIAIEGTVNQINSGNFISKYAFKNASSISRALQRLIDNELIYKSEKGYIVYDKLMGLWLKRISK
jgi:hypothetical protein